MSRLSRQSSKAEPVNDDDDDMPLKLKRESSIDGKLAHELSSARVTSIKNESSASPIDPPSRNTKQTKASRSSSPSSTARLKLSSDEINIKAEMEQSNGDVSPTKPQTPVKPKSGRSAASKGPPPRVAPLLDYLPDATKEAKNAFTVIDSSTYQNKYLAFTESALECECSEEWSQSDSSTKQNHACGDDSDCINRATKMECDDDCNCGAKCQNQRFSRRLYADVSVVQTEKKGYGLRTNEDLKPHDFIFEYIGEVIAEAAFRRRMVAYDQEGIKHFYFMSLRKGEFIDATKKGNLGRFCNHSCNPNCYVDKWVIGDKLRMGIFAERTIKAGEELVFNYNVDRYGANPQPCYCGESNCTGFIGGKTQTERGTKLSAATIEALGIEDADDWDLAVAKKPKKKKTGEDDEDYVESVEAKTLDPDGVTKVMAALMQCKEKWIAVKLLQRIQNSQDELVPHRIVKLHGYRILNSQLSAWRDDENIIMQILDILDKLPRLTRNKIVDSRIDQTLQSMVEHSDGRVGSRASSLLDAYSQLELAYRIPRKRREKSEVKVENTRFERREIVQERKRSRSRSRSPPKGPSISTAPSGPRAQQKPGGFQARPPPPPFHRSHAPLPAGWFTAQDRGKTYFYSKSGQTTWTRPTQPADQPPPPPKQPSEQDVLKSIIDNIVTAKEKDTKSTTPQTPEPTQKEKKEERWKSYDEEKKKKIYENTLFPHVSHVMNKYKHKIPKDDLKRFAKELTKKLVASDFKAGRVQNPNKIDEKQQRKVKEFCKQFFDKAAQKHKQQEEQRTARKVKKESKAATSSTSSPKREPEVSPVDVKTEDTDDEDMKMSDDEVSPVSVSEANGATLKRKREDGSSPKIKNENDPTQSPQKRIVLDTDNPPPPPPPPAPPIETPPGSTPRDEMEIDSQEQDHDHGDTNFRDKSMADVLAQAQQEGDADDEELGTTESRYNTEGKGDEDTRFEDGAKQKGLIPDDAEMENPLVDGQDIVERVKEEEQEQS